MDYLNKIDSKMSFTVDGWISKHTLNSYYGTTVHFIDTDWKLKSMVLKFTPTKAKHYGEGIARIFLDGFKELI